MLTYTHTTSHRLKKEFVGRHASSLIHILIRSFNHGDYESALEQAKVDSNTARSSATSAATESGQKVDSYTPTETGQNAQQHRMLQPAQGLFARLTLILKSPMLHHILHRVLREYMHVHAYMYVGLYVCVMICMFHHIFVYSAT